MNNYFLAALGVGAAALTGLKFKRDKEAQLKINEFLSKDTHSEASITDGLGKTYRVFGTANTWWYKKTGEKVPGHIAQVIMDFREDQAKKQIRAILSEHDDKVIIRDGKKLAVAKTIKRILKEKKHEDEE